MKKLLIITLFALFGYSASAQPENGSNKTSTRDKITRPLFQNETPESAFLEWFNGMIASEGIIISEPTLIEFAIDEDGVLSDIETLSNTTDTVLVRQVERILESSPRWSPAHRKKKFFESCYFLVKKSPDEGFLLKHEDDVESAMPEFYGGLSRFREWVKNRVENSYQAVSDNDKLTIRFIVNTEGYIEIKEIIRSTSPGLSSAVMKVLFTSPRWTPGTVEGFPVKIHYVLPVEFRRQEKQNTWPPAPAFLP